jgi:hypothetical protein
MESKMNDELSNITNDLREISENAQKTFGQLSAEQLNWRPSAEGWSVGQCFEHLIKTNEFFFDELDRIAAGERQNSFLEKYSPLSGFFGKTLIGSMKKDERKYKTTPAATPPSAVDPNIIEIFAAHQSEFIGKIEKTAAADWNKIKLTSPFLSIATYKLADGYRILIEHERRHFRQAERVTKEAGFPK